MSGLLVSQILTISSLVFAVSVSLNFLIIKTQPLHIHLSADSQFGSQKIHHGFIPRIGGMAIFISLLICCLTIVLRDVQQLVSVADHALIMLLCSLPAFILGIAEDITKSIKPLIRLLACSFAGLLGWFAGFRLESVEILFIDNLLDITLVSLLATMFVVAALSNAMNMLDGLNGLSSGYATLAFLFLAYVAFISGDHTLGLICVIFSCAILGFFTFNWPFGKIFLGDGGAYFIGVIMAYIAMKMVQNIDWVTQAFILVIFVYPAWEITASISRRFIKKLPLTQPEQGHLHALLFNKVSASAKVKSSLANPLSALILLMIAATLTAISIFFMQYLAMPQGTKFYIVLVQFLIYSSISLYLKQK